MFVMTYNFTRCAYSPPQAPEQYNNTFPGCVIIFICSPLSLPLNIHEKAGEKWENHGEPWRTPVLHISFIFPYLPPVARRILDQQMDSLGIKGPSNAFLTEPLDDTEVEAEKDEALSAELVQAVCCSWRKWRTP